MLNSFRLYLLGAPRLQREDELLQADTRKATAILAFLAMTGQPQSRDTLAAFLWPEFPQTNARAALRRTISALHRSMGESFLEIQQDLLALPGTDRLWVDVWEFRRCLAKCENHGHPSSQVCSDCLPWLVKASRLYTDSFMAGFTLRDSIEFDDWQFFQSEALRRDLSGVLERLVNGCAALGDFKSAIDHAKRWLSLDSLHEPAHRLLMLLYASAGQRTSALRQYQECVQILDDELGVSPLEETRKLFEDIKNGREIAVSPPLAVNFAGPSMKPVGQQTESARAASPDEPLTGQILTPLPLTGRDAEWTKLQQVYSAIQQDGRLLVLEGEAGIGKTRLSNEFIATVRQAGAGVITATCYPGEANLALAPFVEGLSRAIDQPAREDWHQEVASVWLSEATRMLPMLSRLRPDLAQTAYSESPGAQTRFFEGVRQVIRGICGTHPPGVIFLDDIQWADETSLELLSYLVRRLPGTPLLALLTWRGEDLGGGHRLKRMLADAQRNEYGEIIQLSRLEPESINKLVNAASVTRGITPALGQRIYAESEGLPYFVVEYLASLPANMPLDDQAGWEMPHGVRDLLHSRLAQISETEWQLLQAAAVVGRSFDFEILRETSGRTDEETVATLESLVARGLVAEVQSGNGEPLPEGSWVPRYDFSHNKLRELVYSETSQARKRLLHARSAEALVGRARRQRELPVPAGQVAHHFRQGGRVSQAAEYYKLAGEQARALYANYEAVTHFQNALALGHPDTAELDEAIGELQTLKGNYNAAIQSFKAALAQKIDSPTEMARLNHKLGEVFHRLGEWEQAERYFQACAETLASCQETGALSHLYADWSRTAYQRGDSERACQMARRAHELAEQANDHSALAQALNILGLLARRHGDLSEAIRNLEDSLTLAVDLADPAARIAALNNLSLAYADQGNHARAIECTLQALDLCSHLGDRHHEAALHNNLADLYHASGQEPAAMVHLKKAVVIFREVGEGGSQGSTTNYTTDRANPEIWKLTEW